MTSDSFQRDNSTDDLNAARDTHDVPTYGGGILPPPIGPNTSAALDTDGALDRFARRYREDWLCAVYRWLARRVEKFARRVPYTEWRFDPRYRVLDPLADRLTFRAIRRGWNGRF